MHSIDVSTEENLLELKLNWGNKSPINLDTSPLPVRTNSFRFPQLERKSSKPALKERQQKLFLKRVNSRTALLATNGSNSESEAGVLSPRLPGSPLGLESTSRTQQSVKTDDDQNLSLGNTSNISISESADEFEEGANYSLDMGMGEKLREIIAKTAEMLDSSKPHGDVVSKPIHPLDKRLADYNSAQANEKFVRDFIRRIYDDPKRDGISLSGGERVVSSMGALTPVDSLDGLTQENVLAFLCSSSSLSQRFGRIRLVLLECMTYLFAYLGYDEYCRWLCGVARRLAYQQDVFDLINTQDLGPPGTVDKQVTKNEAKDLLDLLRGLRIGDIVFANERVRGGETSIGIGEDDVNALITSAWRKKRIQAIGA